MDGMEIMSVVFFCIILLILILVVRLSLRGKSHEEIQLLLKENSQTRTELRQMLESQRTALATQVSDLENRLSGTLVQVEGKNDKLADTVALQLEKIRIDNQTQLDEMRRTVDARLTTTLDSRLGESFKIVSNQLEVVNRSLKEMQSLADGVGDLSRLLGNIKTRGSWGELQAQNLLDEVFVSTQYEKNVETRKGSGQRVEFALKLPGEKDIPVYLPIDAKFPREDYERLQQSLETGDQEGCRVARVALARRMKEEAKKINGKYLDPPATTDFAIMYLPIEGLYAEVLNIPGLVDDLQRDFKVVPSGPTTFLALLNSLQMGFRTLAIEKRSEEVWKVLSSVKSEFSKFGEQVEKVQQKLVAASGSVEQLGRRTRVMNSRLKDVELLDEAGDNEPAEVQ
ncbi:MAG: DNA recombination protein RmuC [Spirochaetia bacterium]|jgi:DNA recombination protein RmuC|nr:DNA recombination protein RmuC [Spirochaetia bacterium]